MSLDQSLTAFQRNALAVTDRPVAPPPARDAGLFRLKRRIAKKGSGEDAAARADAEHVISVLEGAAGSFETSLRDLSRLKRPRLLGKPEEEARKAAKARELLAAAREALVLPDFGACGKAVREACRQLGSVGGPLTVALHQELGQAAFSRQKKDELARNMAASRDAQADLDAAQSISPRETVLASAPLFLARSEGMAIAAQILGDQAPAPAPARTRQDAASDLTIIPPQDLETLADVGGLDEAKEKLRASVGVMLERQAEAARSRVVINGIPLYGPPGTGKTMLARAVAGEYGLRFIRFSPAAIASAYQHEPAKKLRQLFAQAASAAPCLLFLDEVDAIATRREASASSDHREIVTQLLNSLEEYRGHPGLVIMAATNTLDQLDPALREGRFDTRIAVPLPDAGARTHILEVTLEASGFEVDWDGLDLEEIAAQTSGRSGAALASIVGGAARHAMVRGGPISQAGLLEEIAGRSGQDRDQTIEEEISWGDVVLPAPVRDRIQEILLVFRKPELGRRLGVRPPAGILLYGPPGTGKTTIARALATEGKASFYEASAADLMSKWVGESEQKVAQLFTRARSNRPSIVFIDEVDALLKARTPDSAAPWEDRIVSQFLGELDGLGSADGVLLIGATNRPDIIDEAVRERRLVPIEVPSPDSKARRALLEVLCRGVNLAADVDFAEIVKVTEGRSGADLKAIKNSAGMKALARAALKEGGPDPAVSRADFAAALAERGLKIPARRAAKPPAKPKAAPARPAARPKAAARKRG